MALRFFADQCVPRSIVRILRDAGHEALILRDWIPKDSPDEIVIEKARELGCILVTLDNDFADIVRYPPASHLGVVALQVKDHPEAIPAIMMRLFEYLEANRGQNHYQGRLFIVETHRLRIRT